MDLFWWLKCLLWWLKCLLQIYHFPMFGWEKLSLSAFGADVGVSHFRSQPFCHKQWWTCWELNGKLVTNQAESDSELGFPPPLPLTGWCWSFKNKTKCCMWNWHLAKGRTCVCEKLWASRGLAHCSASGQGSIYNGQQPYNRIVSQQPCCSVRFRLANKTDARLWEWVAGSSGTGNDSYWLGENQ